MRGTAVIAGPNARKMQCSDVGGVKKSAVLASGLALPSGLGMTMHPLSLQPARCDARSLAEVKCLNSPRD